MGENEFYQHRYALTHKLVNFWQCVLRLATPAFLICAAQDWTIHNPFVWKIMYLELAAWLISSF
ncbi:hypothetical protein K493DRAFT_309908, partial [Basidiobolus meristosporus CBS 931.73]